MSYVTKQELASFRREFNEFRLWVRSQLEFKKGVAGNISTSSTAMEVEVHNTGLTGSYNFTVAAADFNVNKVYFFVRGSGMLVPGVDYTFNTTTKVFTTLVPFVATDGGSITSDTVVVFYQP